MKVSTWSTFLSWLNNLIKSKVVVFLSHLVFSFYSNGSPSGGGVTFAYDLVMSHFVNLPPGIL